LILTAARILFDVPMVGSLGLLLVVALTIGVKRYRKTLDYTRLG
jgi:hypothetical protein